MNTASSTPFDQHYQSHLKHLKLKGLQPKTVDAYARTIRRVGDYFGHQIEHLTEAQKSNGPVPVGEQSFILRTRMHRAEGAQDEALAHPTNNRGPNAVHLTISGFHSCLRLSGSFPLRGKNFLVRHLTLRGLDRPLGLVSVPSAMD